MNDLYKFQYILDVHKTDEGRVNDNYKCTYCYTFVKNLELNEM